MVDDRTVTVIGILAAISMLMGVNYTFFGDADLEEEANYICEERTAVAFCYSLSSTAKTCYTNDDRTGGKRCSGGWLELEDLITVKQHNPEAVRVRCTPDGCE